MNKYIKFLSLIILSVVVMWYYVQQKITVSIIVPVYNSEKYIARCLDSIVSQQGNFEVVIVNDGSTDSTQKIIDELEK